MEVFYCDADPNKEIPIYEGNCFSPNRPESTKVCSKVKFKKYFLFTFLTIMKLVLYIYWWSQRLSSRCKEATITILLVVWDDLLWSYIRCTIFQNELYLMSFTERIAMQQKNYPVVPKMCVYKHSNFTILLYYCRKFRIGKSSMGHGSSSIYISKRSRTPSGRTKGE